MVRRTGLSRVLCMAGVDVLIGDQPGLRCMKTGFVNCTHTHTHTLGRLWNWADNNVLCEHACMCSFSVWLCAECMLKHDCTPPSLSASEVSLHLGMWLGSRLPHLPKPKQCLPNKDSVHSPRPSLTLSLPHSFSLQGLYHSFTFLLALSPARSRRTLTHLSLEFQYWRKYFSHEAEASAGWSQKVGNSPLRQEVNISLSVGTYC